MTAVEQYNWQAICNRDDLVAGSGVCALIGREQIALFYLPDEDDKIFALHNRDPVSAANVISRGLVGDIDGRLVVASPLYKQHFDLLTGECLEEESLNVQAYSARLDGDTVLLAL
jgi:nitrite reductase (NADH) small subunit